MVSTYDRVSPSHEHELSETETPDDLRGLRVLLVEDSPVVADALKQHLELLGATEIPRRKFLTRLEATLARGLTLFDAREAVPQEP